MVLSVAGLAAHVAAARLGCQNLDFVVVATSRAVQANFDLRGDEPGSMNNGVKKELTTDFSSTTAPLFPYLSIFADGAAARSRSDVVGEVRGHQHRVPGWEGARFAVAHAGVDQVGAFACATTVTADGHVKGW